MQPDHNRVVLTRVWRATAALVVAPFLALTSTLAPMHAHEPDADETQPVIHSHVELHEAVGRDSDGANVDHPIGHIVWLDSAILHAPVYQLDSPTIAAASVEAPAVSQSWSVIAFDAAVPIHGPPRLTPAFRGPPSPLRLN
jgi:hypothetical protein